MNDILNVPPSYNTRKPILSGNSNIEIGIKLNLNFFKSSFFNRKIRINTIVNNPPLLPVKKGIMPKIIIFDHNSKSN